MTHSHKLFFKALALLLVIGFLPLNAQPVQGQDQPMISMIEPNVIFRFGEAITFHMKVQSALPIKQVSLLFRSAAEEITHVENVQVAEDGTLDFTYDASLNVIPPFSEVTYWVQGVLSDDKTYTSNPESFTYNDNRFTWSELTSANVTVHWYVSDDSFGAAALDAAGTGMLAMREFIPISLTDPIHIYIYSTPEDLQATLMLGGKEWVGGHTTPQIGVVLVAVAPDSSQAMMMGTRIPHELTHVMLYRSLGNNNYKHQPAWLVEGLASMMESYPSPDHKHALDIASQNNTLIPFENLCDSFPPDSGSAYLAYAQSKSFVTYIIKTFGTSGITRLISAYSDGLGCDLGATSALGAPLSQLDIRWREDELGQNVTGVAMRNLSPFFLIMALVLIVPLWGTIDLLRQKRKREEQYAEKPKIR